MFRAIILSRASLLCSAALIAALSGAARGHDNELVARASTGAQANAGSSGGFMTPDARFIVFTSTATNLAVGETSTLDVWVRDRLLGTTAKVSVPDPSMPQVLGNDSSSLTGSNARVISDDGRYIVFTSFASNLVASDTNTVSDVFVRDRDADNDGVFDETGAGNTRTVRVSVTSSEGQSFGACPNDTCTHGSYDGTISADGRHVAFVSDFNFAGVELFQNIYRRDRDADNDGIFDESANSPVNAAITELVTPSISCGGCEHNGYAGSPAISGDGRHIAFESASSRQTFSDFNNAIDVFVRDMEGDTYRLSERADGTPGEPSADSHSPSISYDGRYIAFQSANDDLDPADNQNIVDIFVRDRDSDNDGDFDEPAGQTIERVSTGTSVFPFPGGSVVPLNSSSSRPSISYDGRYVAFHSAASNNSCGLLDCADQNDFNDIFLHDRMFQTTTLVPISTASSTAGQQGNNNSTLGIVSPDGRFVSYVSQATNFINGDQTGSTADVFVRALRNDTNNLCSTIQTVTAGSYFGDTWGAGDEGNDSCITNEGPDAFFSYTAPCTGQIVIDTIGSSYDTALSVHTACPGSEANQIVCNDDLALGILDSLVTVFVQQGQTYVIRLSGFSFDSGFYQLNVSNCSPCCPGNADKALPPSVTFADITEVLLNFTNIYDISGMGDADCNGIVNFVDITAVLLNFNTQCN